MISDSAPAGLTTDIAYFETHRQASLRFRVGIPARALSALGVQSAFVGLDTPAVLEHLTSERVDAVVFAKLSTPRGATYEAFTAAYLGTARHARARGLPVVVDLEDNVFATDRRDFFRERVASADAVTACSETLAGACRHDRPPRPGSASVARRHRRCGCSGSAASTAASATSSGTSRRVRRSRRRSGSSSRR